MGDRLGILGAVDIFFPFKSGYAFLSVNFVSKHKLTKTKIFYNLENDDIKALKYTYIQKRERERGME